MLVWIDSGHQKLCKVNLSWTISVDIIKYFLNPFVVFMKEGGILLEGIPDFLNLDDPIFVFVEIFKILDEKIPFLTGQKLRNDVGVHHSF